MSNLDLDNRDIIFFIAGSKPTTAEQGLIDRIRGNVLVMTANDDISPLYGTKLRHADGLAGSIPNSYKTGEGTTIDLTLYPYGDVTPLALTAGEDFEVLPATLAIKVGETKNLVAAVADLDEEEGTVAITNKAVDDTVVWSSSDETKATVDTDGVVTGVAAGTATITGSYDPGAGVDAVTDTCVVTVSAATAENEIVLPSTVSVVVGKTVNLKAAEAKSDGSLADVTTDGAWSSSDETKATVGAATGVVTGVDAGESVITFTKGGKTATCTVTVVAATAENEIVLPSTVSVVVGKTVNLKAAEAKSDGSLADVTTDGAWSSSDETKATVGAATGVVTGVDAGESVITFTKGGKTATCTVTVVAATAENEIVLPSTVSVVVGKTVNLKAAEAKSDGSLADVTTDGAWSSSDETKATVGAATGVVTGVDAGESVITFTKGGKTATCTVTVVAATTEAVKVFPSTASIAALGTVQLYAVEAKTDDTLVESTGTTGAWSSSDDTKVVVNADTGVATGQAGGEATITFTKGGKTSTCVVTCTG